MSDDEEEGEVLDIHHNKRPRLEPVVTSALPRCSAQPVKFLTRKQRQELVKQQEKETVKRREEMRQKVEFKRHEYLKRLQDEQEKKEAEERRKAVQHKRDDELTLEETAERNAQQELEQMRNQYLGVSKDRRKLQKPSEKFRNIFQFDWDFADDTTKGDYNPVYTERYNPQLLFGRGFRAGMDIREQRKQNMFYDSLSAKRIEVLKSIHNPNELNLEAVAVTKIGAAVKNVREGATEEEDKEDDREAKPLSEMTERDWRIVREDHSIVIKGGQSAPPPMRTWDESALPPAILDAVSRVGYQKPTPIQMQAIPIALIMTDLIGIAETGSGKTAAFMLPMLSYVAELPRLNDETAQRGPYGLVLAPARELALQIRDEADKFCGYLQIRNVAIVGGRNAEEQAYKLRIGAEIVIGTPGRIKDCLEKAYTVLTQCNYVVLDEADRMIDLGFEPSVNWILEQIPSTKPDNWSSEAQAEIRKHAGFREGRVTQMFSATMPAAVERLARRYLCNPLIIQVGNPGEGKKSIQQIVEFVHDVKKMDRLRDVCRAHLPGPIIVFVNQKKSADMLSRMLIQNGVSSVSLHGGKAQDIREDSLETFKNGDVDVLVATDVAGRGIDVDGVRLVVNYDMPADIEGYTHRIGRTGRAGKEGKAMSFLTEDDSRIFYDLKLLLQTTGNAIPKALNEHPASDIKPVEIKRTVATPWPPL